MKNILQNIWYNFILWVVVKPIFAIMELIVFVYDYRVNLLIVAAWILLPVLIKLIFGLSLCFMIVFWLSEIILALLYVICKCSGIASRMEERLDEKYYYPKK